MRYTRDTNRNVGTSAMAKKPKKSKAKKPKKAARKPKRPAPPIYPAGGMGHC